MKVLAIAAALCGVLLAADPFCPDAHGQDYPSRDIKIIVTFPAGSTDDVAARIVGQELQKRLGQAVVVENRTGGSGSIGGSHVARSAPDGYTLLLNGIASVINMHYLDLTYDPSKDFSPVGMIGEGPPLVLVVNSSSPYKSVKELLAAAQAQPGKLNFATTGEGTVLSIAVSQLRLMANIDYVEVPYRGAGQVTTSVLSGDTQAAFVFPSTARSLSDEGKVRALAVTSAARTADWPQLPTMIESGFAGFEHQAFAGLSAPRQTPAPIVALLNRHLNDIVNEPSVRAGLARLGMVPREKNTPADFAEYLQAKMKQYGELARLTKK